MKISGLQKNSLIDFPGEISCVLFTNGCNFICPYCHNPEIAGGSSSGTATLIEEQEIFSFLEKRKNLLNGVVITGGEPTLHKDLDFFCYRIKKMGYKIKLDTNGSNPKVLEDLYKKELVDFTAMDIKSNLKNYHLAAGKNFNPDCIMASIKLIMERSPLYEFRTTCVKPFLDTKIICDIGNMIQGASHYVLQHCSKDVKMLTPDFFKQKNRFFSDNEIIDFSHQVEKYVKKCSIR